MSLSSPGFFKRGRTIAPLKDVGTTDVDSDILIIVVINKMDALDKNSCAVLVMLDLSAAFDHTILRKRLEYSFGISSGALALQWLLSYLQDRTRRIAIGSTSVLSSFNLSMFEHIHELISVKQPSSRFGMSIQFSSGSNTR
jgi:hypothetical protein